MCNVCACCTLDISTMSLVVKEKDHKREMADELTSTKPEEPGGHEYPEHFVSAPHPAGSVAAGVPPTPLQTSDQHSQA